ncbi:sensor domain-containing diguanylate cyclase [Paenibacillus terrae]|uniref:sensor domain-containing diguanylate cyclase n=1 Tax=Paenibacillus terrae TaxID=159743 RepID=UPI00207B2CAC|nr:sensor domain-containing diguanylate cyclase [Paenibacillus terrae]
MSTPRRAEHRQSKKLSLISLLTGLVTLVVLLTSSILLVGSYESQKKSLTETTLHLNYSNADRISRTMDSLFRSMRGSLEYSADKLSDVDAMTSKQVDDYLDLMRNSSNFFNSISVVEANGLIRNVAPARVGTAGQHITSKASLEALALQKPYISSPYMTPNTKRLIVFMSQPIFSRSDKYLGILSGTLYLQENNILSDIFGNGNVDDSGSYYYIVDSNGRLLYHPDKQLLGEDVSSNKVVQKLMKGESGEQQVRNTSGVEMLAGYSSVPANGWGIVVVSPISLIHHQLMGQIQTILWYSLFPFITLLIGVILVAYMLARPFVHLANLVSKMGKEEIVMPEAKSHWSQEADLLTKAVLLAVLNIQKQTDQLTQEAVTDVLTGLMNRRSLENTMSQWMASGLPFSLIMLDVDKFKFVNDTYGHLIGDEVLKHVAEVIVTSLRPDDVCYRYGGEEFVILLNRPEEAFNVAERVRRALEQSRAPIPTRVTVSLGIAHYPLHASEREELIEKADQALYLAKSRGRNRTIVSEG